MPVIDECRGPAWVPTVTPPRVVFVAEASEPALCGQPDCWVFHWPSRTDWSSACGGGADRAGLSPRLTRFPRSRTGSLVSAPKFLRLGLIRARGQSVSSSWPEASQAPRRGRADQPLGVGHRARARGLHAQRSRLIAERARTAPRSKRARLQPRIRRDPSRITAGGAAAGGDRPRDLATAAASTGSVITTGRHGG